MKVFDYKFLVFFLFCSTALYSQESRLALEAEALAIVHGCVNVVTGEFIQQATDLMIDTPSPLFHSRIYDSGNSNLNSTLGDGFTWNIPRKVHFLKSYPKRGNDEGNFVDGGTTVISIEEREGVPLVYHGQHNGIDGQQYRIRDSVLKHGYTNYSPWGISGVTSLHNITPLHQNYEKHNKGGQFSVTLGCGTKRIYSCKGAELRWLLSKEIRPNGNRVFYDYDEGATLRKVWLTGTDETTPIASYALTYEDRSINVEGSNGQKVQYITGEVFGNQRHLLSVEGEHLPKTEYLYADKDLNAQIGRILQVVHPAGRIQGISYYPSG